MKVERTQIHQWLFEYRYELLMSALLVLIFDRSFFPENDFFLMYIWPLNMALVSITCYGIFKNSSRRVQILRVLFSFVSVLQPFLFAFLYHNQTFVIWGCAYTVFYYLFIFGEIMRQITSTREIKANVLLGTICGYLLIVLSTTFSLMIMETLHPNSFKGTEYKSLLGMYDFFVYFSFTTITSLGFGDIYPITKSARMFTSFVAMFGQFYMAAVVGIVVSRLSSKA